MKILFLPLIIMLAACYSIPFVQEGEANALENFNKAEALFNQQQYQEAIPLYESSLKIRDLLIDTYKHLSICYEKTGRDDEAVRILEKSLLVTNKDEDNLNNLIRLYDKVGRVEDAKRTKEWLNYIRSQAIGGKK